jgi:hypothetical protein
MRRLRILLLLLLLGLLGWGATEAGLALGDRLAAAVAGEGSTGGGASRGTDADGRAGDAGTTAVEDGPSAAGRAIRQRQFASAEGSAHGLDDPGSSGAAPGQPAPSADAADAARSASAAAFRRNLRRLGAGLGLTPPDPLGPVADAGDGTGDRSAFIPSPRRDPSLDGPDAPGRAVPAKPAEPERIEVVWDGNGRYRSVITVDPGEGLRRPARVETYLTADPSRPIVTYDATAFRDQAGELHVDARGSQVSGPWAGNWSPDSFGIDDYGQVRALDDQPIGGQGSVGARGPR